MLVLGGVVHWILGPILQSETPSGVFLVARQVAGLRLTPGKGMIWLVVSTQLKNISQNGRSSKKNG